MPLYRQENILQRIGVDIPRATLANWMIQAGTLVQPLINLLRDRLLAYDILQMDETTVQVLNGKRPANPPCVEVGTGISGGGRLVERQQFVEATIRMGR